MCRASSSSSDGNSHDPEAARASRTTRDTKEVPLIGKAASEKWEDENREDRPAERNGALMTAIQLVNSMIGSGILAFPYVLADMGLVMALVWICVFVSLNYFSNLALLETATRVGQPTGDQSDIIEAAMQSRKWARTVDLCIAIQSFGSLLSYFNVMGALGADLLKPTRDDNVALNTYPGVILIAALVLSPACFYRAYGDIAHISLLSFALIVLTTFSVVGKASTGMNAIPLGPKSALAPFTGMGNFAFAVSNQFALNEAYASMKPTDRPAVRSVVALQASLGGSLLLIMAIAGVAAVGMKTLTSNILESLSPTNTFNKTLKGLTILHLMAYIPNDFIIMRLYACRFFHINPLTIPEHRYVLLTIVLLAIPAVIMAAIPRPDVNGVFELIITLTGDIPIGIGVLLVPLLAFKRTVLDNLNDDPDIKNSEDTRTLFPHLKQYRHLYLFYIFIVIVLLVVAPITVGYTFINDCLTKSCQRYGDA
mmetsp:Transcript_38139/g.122441  ORF Transcript_38139/g.122441 Transcript_38139/m.122441 type:complete len:482 (-) Transcript_38139:322-1767(-)